MVTTSMRKMSLLLPVAIMFSIIAINNGGYNSGYGGYNNLYLQPTIPYFPPASGFGSFYMAASPMQFMPTYYSTNYAPSFIGYNYNNYNLMPTYQYQHSVNLIRFETQSYALPIEPIYTTPTTGLFNVNYQYSNVGKLW